MDICALLDAARAHSSIPSDNRLARTLGIHASSVVMWRKRAKLPSDENIVLLCELAGISPEAGLLALNMLRCRGRAHATYGQIANHLGLELPFPTKSKSAA